MSSQVSLDAENAIEALVGHRIVITVEDLSTPSPAWKEQKDAKEITWWVLDVTKLYLAYNYRSV